VVIKIRDQLGSEMVSFADDELIQYINEMKGQYLQDHEEPRGNAGKVGTDDEFRAEEDVADYVSHSSGGAQGGM